MQSGGVKGLETQPKDSQAKWGGYPLSFLNRKGKDIHLRFDFST